MSFLLPLVECFLSFSCFPSTSLSFVTQTNIFPRLGSRKSRVLRPFWSNFHSTKVCVFFYDLMPFTCVSKTKTIVGSKLFIYSSAAVDGFMALLRLQFLGQFRDPNSRSLNSRSRGRAVTSERLFFVFRPQKRPRWHKQMTSNLFRPKLSRESSQANIFHHQALESGETRTQRTISKAAIYCCSARGWLTSDGSLALRCKSCSACDWRRPSITPSA